MSNFLHSRGFKVLLAVVFLLLGVVLYTASTGNSLTASLFGFVTTPMQTVTTNIAQQAGDYTTKFKSPEELKAENDALQKEIDDLRKKLIDYNQLKQENEQLKQVVNVQEQNKDFKFVSSSVIGRDPNETFYGFTLDRGSIAGIAVNDPVYTSSGLVGFVSSVSATYCHVKTILSPDAKVGAIDNVNRDSGVVTGNVEMADQGLCKMQFISSQNTMKAGDVIITSGLGGMYPRNLPIGEVVEVKPEEHDVSLYAVIKPYADVQNVRDVFVITEFQGQGDVLKSIEPGIASSASSPSGSSSQQASSQASSKVSSGAASAGGQ